MFVTNLLVWSSEVDEHFPDEDTPALLLMAVFHLDQPALHGGLLVLLAQQELQCVPLDDVLEDPHPLLHDGLGVGREVVGLPSARGDLEGVAAVRSGDSTRLVKDDDALRLPVEVMLVTSNRNKSPSRVTSDVGYLRLPVGNNAGLENEISLVPRLDFSSKL